MADDRVRELVSHARVLEQRDAELAVRIETVAALLARVDEVRAGAGAVSAELSRVPGELAAIGLAEQAARESEASARLALADAELRLEEVTRSRRKREEARAHAERSALRAGEAVTEAVARVARAGERRHTLLEHDAALQVEARSLAAAAGETAAAILDVPSVSVSGRSLPGAGFADIDEWGGRAHAALFVVRSALEAERQQIVDEANVLGAAVLREQLAGSNVSLVRQRLEAVLAMTS